MAPGSAASGCKIFALMPSVWLAIFTLILNVVNRPPDDHIPDEGQGSSVHTYTFDGSGVILQEPGHLERSLFAPDSDKTTEVLLANQSIVPLSCTYQQLEHHQLRQEHRLEEHRP